MFAVSLFVVIFTVNASAQSTIRPELVSSVPSDYPKRARELGITGNAEFRAEVDAKGRVRNVEVLKVPREDVGFEDAVRKAVKKWKFAPARADGIAVAGQYESFVRFSLRPEDEETIRQLVSEPRSEEFTRSRTRIRVRGEWADRNSLLRDWLRENSQPDRVRDQIIRVKSITFAPQIPNSASVSVTRHASGGPEEDISIRVTNRPGGWFVIWVGPTWDTDPVLIHKAPHPDYPERARDTMMSGSVHLLVVVTVDGRTEILEVLTPLPDGLTETSRKNAVQWRWEPALRAGKRVEAVGIISVSYWIGR